MKDKLKFLTKQSLDKKIKTKWFVGVNIFLLVLLIVLVNIDRIVTFFGGDFNEEISVIVHDEVGGYDAFKTYFESSAESLGEMKNYKVELSSDSLENLQNSLEKDDNKIIVSLEVDPTNYLKGQMISFDEIGTISTQLIQSSINTLKQEIAIRESGLTEEQIMSLTSPATIETVLTNPDKENEANKDLIAAGVIMIIILPSFFLILTLVQMIGSEVNDEKTTRSMEIIISNVSPQTHFLSKVFSSTLFVIIQGVLLILEAIVAVLVRVFTSGGMNLGGASGDIASQISSILTQVSDSGILTTVMQGLPWILLLFLFSFVLYAIVAGVLASMTTSMEDFQQLQTPIMLVIMAGYYLAIMASQFEGALFIKIMSYIPMISFMVSPALFMLGQIGIWELVISTLITIVCTWVFFKYGLRIYKVGILNYSSSKLWKKMWKSLKTKEPKKKANA